MISHTLSLLHAGQTFASASPSPRAELPRTSTFMLDVGGHPARQLKTAVALALLALGVALSIRDGSTLHRPQLIVLPPSIYQPGQQANNYGLVFQSVKS
jgi:hypothetical protein